MVIELFNGKELPVHLLVDSGASGPILHEDFVRKHGLLVKKRKQPKEVKNANEELIPNAGTHYTQPTMLIIGQHEEDIIWEIGQIESQIDGYLPVSWLQKHNPDIDWEKGTLKWRSFHCRTKCLKKTILARLMDHVQMERELETNNIMATAIIWPHDE